jgi:hypothetical protein
MDIEYFFIFLVLLTLLILLIQRTEPAKRRLVLFIMIIPALLIRNFAVYRDVETEAWTALWIALFINFLFWLFIGRYHPVKSSDEIRVLGMDD